MFRRALMEILWLALLTVSLTFAAIAQSPDIPEPGSVEAIAAATTDPHYVSPWVGMPGVSTWNFGEAFAHLYLDSVAMNHNSIGRGYETFGNGSAETEKRSISPSAASMQWYRPLPGGREARWSARDKINYQETGALAALDELA